MSDTTPSEKLAAIVVEKLIENDLVRESNRGNFLPKVSSGKINRDDWKLEMELAKSATGRE